MIPTQTDLPRFTESEPPFQFRLLHLILAVTFCGVVLAIAVPVWRKAWLESNKTESAINLHQIGVALHEYHDVHEAFPPAYTVDASGRRMHSWRVLIIPYMESSSFHASYDFTTPWNSASNAPTRQSPRYRSPRDTNSQHGMTSYVAIVGPGTMWPGTKSTSRSDVTDGSSQTCMVIEIRNSDIHWMEPRDLPIEELEAWLDPSHRPSIVRDVAGGLVTLADGSVEVLPPDIAVDRLKAMISPAGNDGGAPSTNAALE